jgi:hypothetical protein
MSRKFYDLSMSELRLLRACCNEMDLEEVWQQICEVRGLVVGSAEWVPVTSTFTAIPLRETGR